MVRLGKIPYYRLVSGLRSLATLFLIAVIAAKVGSAATDSLMDSEDESAVEITSQSVIQKAESCKWRLGDFDWKLQASRSAGVVVGQAIGPSPFHSRRMLVLLSLALEAPAEPGFVTIDFGLTVSSLRILEPEMPAMNSIRVFLKNAGYPLVLFFEIDTIEEGASIGSVSIRDNSPEHDITLMRSEVTEQLDEIGFAAGIFELCRVGAEKNVSSKSIARVLRQSLHSHSDQQRRIVATEAEKLALLNDPSIDP